MDIPSVHALWEQVHGKVLQAQQSLGIEATVDPVQPPSEDLGHLGFPAFSFARQLRRNPQEIARDLAALISPDELIARVETVKGYVNIYFDEEYLARCVLHAIFRDGEDYARGGGPGRERWVLEYSAPNTNKPLHLGHIRNNLLGMAVSRMAEYYGHDVVKVNLINDRGIHICKTMVAYQRWGQGKTPGSEGRKGDHFVGDFYVAFEREFGKEFDGWAAREESEATREEFFNGPSELGGATREMLREWEEGRPEVVDLWRRMNRWVLEGFDETYRRMGCDFDEVQFESQTYKLGREVVRAGLEQGVFQRRADGAVVLNLDRIDMEGEKVLLRPDGTSVYMTQDIGTAVARIERHRPDRLIYVVGDEQIYHFQVLFKLLGLVRENLSQEFHHLVYGMVRLPEGRMKSREGTVVDADDLMNELRVLAAEEISTRAGEGRAHTEGLSEEDLQFRAERIAQAALKFFVFRFTPRKSFEYNPRQSIDFTGQTGPYCLYCYARTRSLIRKSDRPPEFDPELVPLLSTAPEKALIRQLFSYPMVVARSVESFDPSKIADYAYELAAGFARLFTDKKGYPIITCEEERLRQARLMLANAVGIVVRGALGLLGIEVLEEM